MKRLALSMLTIVCAVCVLFPAAPLAADFHGAPNALMMGTPVQTVCSNRRTQNQTVVLAQTSAPTPASDAQTTPASVGLNALVNIPSYMQLMIGAAGLLILGGIYLLIRKRKPR